MPRYVDVDKLLNYLDARAFAAVEMWDGEASRNAFLAAMDAVARCTIIDAVEVVRCKDCIHSGRSPFGYSPTMIWCKLHGHHRRFDYYCASAEVQGEN